MLELKVGDRVGSRGDGVTGTVMRREHDARSVTSLGNFLSITSANTDQRQFRLGLRMSF
jgi:hypothetical protein